MTTYFHAVLSPCTGVCTLADDGLCRGCHRTGDEIAAWSTMTDEARLHAMDVVLPARAEHRAAT
ncbi:DUF1289 domain-containing protein [Thermomonas sp.]|jgi:hypothetical protein|uniref:DUF1289 domain-containing protein n=1 Tax=Thermomonas sp. TaxID=1971895 RepID=UPI002D1FBCA7|nr:DUF1289 domain-containing protein [Thermomonas sp.]